MRRRHLTIILIILLCQLTSCTMIYRSVRDKLVRSYQEGIVLYKQNKFAEAYDRFDTVVDIEPNYKDAKKYLRKAERQMLAKEKKLQQRANVNYDKGVALMKKGQYDGALDLFLLAKKQDPEHDEVDDKIDECREKLAPKFEGLLKQAERLYDKKQYVPAYKTCLQASDYNPTSGDLSSLKGKIEDRLEDASEKFYDKGKQFYNKKNYGAAEQQLAKALTIHPWHEPSKELLGKARGRLNLDKNYNSAVTMYNSANYFGAKNAFNAVNNVEPGYKATAQYLSKIENALSSQVPGFYNSGVSLYDKGNYQAAIAEFNKVLAINPGHSQAAEYRQRAQTKLDIQKSVGGTTE